jgi:GMP synthase (glutamine-hydrolysing)
MTHHRPITVIDLGGQYAHLIASKFRGLGYHAVIADPEAPLEEIAKSCGVVLSGSPSLSAYDEDGSAVRRILDLPLPILGFCFGHQEIAKHYGGTVIHGQPEYGPSTLTITRESPIFRGVPEKSVVFMSHGDTVTAVGPGFYEIGTSAAGDGPVHRFAAIADEERRRWGFQYHPEVDDSVYGHVMLGNFAELCGCKKTWDAAHLLPEKLEAIRRDAAGRDVFLLVSGGVDSSVVAELLLQALPPERVHMLHVDTGFMREAESAEVRRLFEDRVGARFHFVDASARFFEALAGVVAPEEKRRIIGELFITVCEEEMSRLSLSDALLAQGTIYPDTIESGGTRRAHVIKTHHNRVPLIEEMIRAGRVLEPIADLYKKEVRELGRALGLPSAWIDRHPFPGPGLAVRVLNADGRVPEELASVQAGVDAAGWPAGVSATVLPLRSVGVKADLRSYELPLCLSGPRPDEDLVATRLKTLTGINRIVWNLGPAFDRVTVVPGACTPERVRTLQAADALVTAALRELDLMDAVWQFPVVLLPLSFSDDPAGCAVVLRPVSSERGMTARVPGLPRAFFDQVVPRILALAGVTTVLLDLSTKPPGTIEWE